MGCLSLCDESAALNGLVVLTFEHFHVAYQDRTCVRMEQDGASAREREPLFTVDDVTLSLLKEKALLISCDCLILAEVVGQGKSLVGVEIPKGCLQ